MVPNWKHCYSTSQQLYLKRVTLLLVAAVQPLPCTNRQQPSGSGKLASHWRSWLSSTMEDIAELMPTPQGNSLLQTLWSKHSNQYSYEISQFHTQILEASFALQTSFTLPLDIKRILKKHLLIQFLIPQTSVTVQHHGNERRCWRKPYIPGEWTDHGRGEETTCSLTSSLADIYLYLPVHLLC